MVFALQIVLIVHPGPSEVEVRRNAQDEALVHDDAVGIAAVGDWGRLMLVRRALSENHVRAELLQSGSAIGTGVIRID
jgi:hypothetical protein